MWSKAMLQCLRLVARVRREPRIQELVLSPSMIQFACTGAGEGPNLVIASIHLPKYLVLRIVSRWLDMLLRGHLLVITVMPTPR